jgi:hypothetical protein
MAKLRDDFADRKEHQDGPPDPANLIVMQLLVPWTRHHGRLPPPCPMDLRDCADWWLATMQEPEEPTETYQCSAVNGGLRWETGYANRCRSALFGFLNIPETRQRDMVVTMVTDDRIPYRGETIRQYYDIAEETYLMRKDPEQYRRDLVPRTMAALRKIVKEAA